MSNDDRKSQSRSNPGNRAVSIAGEQIEHSILVVRGHKVLLDQQLAEFYGVETKFLVRAMKRNIERFPDDFTFQLSGEEWDALRCQFGTLNMGAQDDASRSQSVTLKAGRGQHRKYLPYAFTEQGVAMLSGVLRSPRAVEVNIQIMRAFVRLRQLLNLHRELAERLEKIEQQMAARDHNVKAQFRKIFSLLDRLFNPPSPSRKPIGFHAVVEGGPEGKRRSTGKRNSSAKRNLRVR